jgi:hypothetical protein
MWKASTTSHTPSVGGAVSGRPVETKQGQTTSQLQFSKYSPLSCHCAIVAS